MINSYRRCENIYKKFKIEDIELILMILTDKNLSKVSEKFNLTQPGISARLDKFRNYYNDKLIIRASNTMILTEKGEKLKLEFNNLLLHIQNFFIENKFDPKNNIYTLNLYVNEYFIYKKNFINALINKVKGFNSKHKLNIHSMLLCAKITEPLGR
jgi:hypothetical protein